MTRLQEIKKGLARLDIPVKGDVPETRIRPVESGKFRTGLNLEDVYEFPGDQIHEVYNVQGGTEKVLVPTQFMIEYPGIDHISNPVIRYDLHDNYKLRPVVFAIMMMSPEIDREGILEMAKWLHRYTMSKVPFKRYYVKIRTMATMFLFEPTQYEVRNYKPCLFQRDSMIPAEERASITRQSGHFIRGLIKGKLIHKHVTQMEVPYKITKPLVHKQMDDPFVKSTIATFRGYFLPETDEYLKKHNAKAPFNTIDEYNKYVEFLSIQGGTYQDKAKQLGVSKSTIKKFSKLNENNFKDRHRSRV
jgi:hypothetical protein